MVFKDKSFIEVFHKIQQAGGEVALVGGVVRNILLNEKFLSDNSSFDLATNLNPDEICKALEKKKINFIIIISKLKFKTQSVDDSRIAFYFSIKHCSVW